MSLRSNIVVGFVALSVLAAAAASWADPLTYRTFVGSLNNFNSFGELGFVHATAQDGHPSDGNFGAAFDNIVTVNSITIDQRNDPPRHRMQNLRIYTSPDTFFATTLTDSQEPQTIALPGGGLTSDYFFITVESFYSAGAVDDNPGLTAFTFDGTVGAPRTNLNSLILPTVNNYFDDPPGTFFTDVVTNGQIVSTTGGPADGLFFEHADTNDRSIIVDYGSPKTVASIGVGFESQILFSYNTRPVPRFVTVTDSNGNSQQMTLEPHTLQYGQYNLVTPFTNTTSLKLTLPIGAENYYPSQIYDPVQPQSTLTGISEFQAFADPIVAVPPEGLAGDYNENDEVDAADYVVWRDNLGSATALPNDDTPGVGQDDYVRWKNNFGNSGAGSVSIAQSAVPEASAMAMCAAASALFGLCRRR